MAVPPPLLCADKPATRRALRAARARHVARLDDAALAEATRSIHARLRPLLPDAGAIGGYVAHRGEPDVMPALIEARRLGRAVALPRVEAGGAMRFVAWHPEVALAAGHAGIREPAGGAEEVPAALLVPLVGFDREGRRLGQGAGCYDRWLAAHPGTRAIGIAWSMQEVASLPADPWDVALDAIVTECGTILP